MMKRDRFPLSGCASPDDTNRRILLHTKSREYSNDMSNQYIVVFMFSTFNPTYEALSLNFIIENHLFCLYFVLDRHTNNRTLGRNNRKSI